MDTIFFNGNIQTMDHAIPKAQAVAIKNGIILRVGSDLEILKLKTKETELVDLKGQLMLPGFNDSHMHLLSYGYSLEKVNLGAASSIEDIIMLGKDRLQAKPEITWLQGRGWNNENWKNNAFPTRYDLDKISKDIPISYTRTCGHIIVTNSKALEIMGITAQTDPVEGGHFDLDENGNPMGIFREAARDFVYNAIPSLSEEDIKRMLLAGGQDLVKCGITSIQSDDLEAVAESDYKKVLQVYKELSEMGTLPVRVYEQCLLPPISRLKEFFSLGYKSGQGNELFKIGPLKLLGDGSLGGRTAYLSSPYEDDPSTRGIRVFSQEELDDLICTAHDNGMPAAVHCIGDGQMRMTFDSIEKAMLKNPRPDMRHSIIHCQITDEFLLNRFRDLHVIAHIQPIFLDSDIHIVEDRVGKALASTSYNWKAMVEKGVHYACGSDSPVENFDVMKNIYCAVTRKDLEGFPEDGWYPEQRLTVEEAVYGFTLGGAYASYEESVKGSITVGKYADFAILNKDIFAIEFDEIKDVRVTRTVLGGKTVYEIC
ncbi:MAG: amidohydrolase [Clostridia bacterium]|nr:amidohydrolase [Clostridia bacterium]